MNGEKFQLFRENLSFLVLFQKNSKDKIIRFNLAKPSQKLASKFYTTTTKLVQLNGVGIKNPMAGNLYNVKSFF